MLDEHPDLQIVPHHLDGMFPFFGNRILSLYRTRREKTDVYGGINWPDYSQNIKSYFEQIYGDTAVRTSDPAITCGLEFFGPGIVLFGVDCPFGPNAGREWYADTVATVDDLTIDDATRERIYRGSAEALFDF